MMVARDHTTEIPVACVAIHAYTDTHRGMETHPNGEPSAAARIYRALASYEQEACDRVSSHYNKGEYVCVYIFCVYRSAHVEF